MNDKMREDKFNKINALENFNNVFYELISEFEKNELISLNDLDAIEDYPFTNCLMEVTSEVTEWVGNMQKEIETK